MSSQKARRSVSSLQGKGAVAALRGGELRCGWRRAGEWVDADRCWQNQGLCISGTDDSMSRGAVLKGYLPTYLLLCNAVGCKTDANVLSTRKYVYLSRHLIYPSYFSKTPLLGSTSMCSGQCAARDSLAD